MEGQLGGKTNCNLSWTGDPSHYWRAVAAGRTGISQLCEAGQVEADKWPLELARPSGLATSVPAQGAARGRRESFDVGIGKSQIVNTPQIF